MRPKESDASCCNSVERLADSLRPAGMGAAWHVVHGVIGAAVERTKLVTWGTQWQLHLSLCCVRPCSADLLCKVLLALRQHGLLCCFSKAVMCELSCSVEGCHSRVQTLIATSCSAGMTEASPTCTMGGLKVCLLSHFVCHAERHKVCKQLL